VVLDWYFCLILFAFADEPFVGASVGYFAFLGVLAGRSFTVILLQDVVGYHLLLVGSI
jgi:hypothetical protein